MLILKYTRLGRGCWLGLFGLLVAIHSADAREIYVNNEVGSDQNAGTFEAPLRSARQAVNRAGPGDVIHLLPEKAVFREMITLADKRDLTIEGHDCVVTGADPLPADPVQWEQVGQRLHRIGLRSTVQDRHILVVDGRAVTMGRTKYQITQKPISEQYPKPTELTDGQFSWEPSDRGFGWLYVKGALDKLEWAVRPQGIYTDREVHNVTIRKLHARHVLNDGFNIHGNAQGIRLVNVTAHECFDNGISPHGACSFTVEDSQFLRNEMAVGNDFLTETHFLRCTIGDSVQEEVMIIGGQHLFEDCRIRATGPVAIRLVVSRPGANRPVAQKEIQASGKDPSAKPRYVFRGCTLESADATRRKFIVGPNVHLVLERCKLDGLEMQVDPSAKVEYLESTLQGAPLGNPRPGQGPK
jgi:hypothetical protein